MKALVLNATHQPLALEERPALEAGPGEVIVELKAAALNRRDFWITQGMYPGIKPPVVLGSDGAGIVSQCGEGVDRNWQDREVILNPSLEWGDSQAVQSQAFSILGLPRDGTFATAVSVPASQLFEKPAHLGWQEAAALPLGGVTAYRALFTQGQLQSDQSVLITGVGGGVATFALQFAVAAGADAWVTSSSSKKIERAMEFGARGGFDYTTDNWWKEMAKQAGGPDLIIDSAGGDGYAALLSLAAPGGRIVNYGATAGPPGKLDLFKVFWKQLHLVGSTMGSPRDFAAMLSFVQEKQLAPVVDSVVPLAEANHALDSMRSSPQFGKIVLEI